MFRLLMFFRRRRAARHARSAAATAAVPVAPFLHPDIFLEDGQNLSPYGWDAQVLHCPGHTPGSVSILTPAGEILIGDTAQSMMRPGLALLIENDADYRSTVAKLAALPLVTILPGHGKPFPARKLKLE